MELMWPCKAVPAPSWGREKQRHWGRAGLCGAARWEPIAVLLQRGCAPAPGLQLLRVSIFPLLGGGEGRSCFVLVDKLGTVMLPVGSFWRAGKPPGPALCLY